MLLGDKVKQILDKSGVGPLVTKVADYLGKDCGCTERQESLNNLHLNALNVYRGAFNRKNKYTKVLNDPEIRKLIAAQYEEHTGKKWGKPTECPSCNNAKIRELLATDSFESIINSLEGKINEPTETKLKAALKKKPIKRKPKKK